MEGLIRLSSDASRGQLREFSKTRLSFLENQESTRCGNQSIIGSEPYLLYRHVGTFHTVLKTNSIPNCNRGGRNLSVQLDTPSARLNAAKRIIEEGYSDGLEKHLRNEDGLDKKEASIWVFHYWMRNYTGLKSGSIVDYRKYVAEFLDENGELDVDKKTLGNHKSAAVSKFQEFKDSEIDVNKKTGDSE